MDLYANGLGVPRNLPLALHLACEDGTGIAADAITDLDKFAKTAPPSPKRFEVCDFANSTFSMNFCGDYQSEITEERRNRAFRRILAQWTPEQKTAFAKLKAAEEKYVETHTSELDQGGTIHTIRDLGSMEIMHNNFLLDLRQFEKGNLPKDTNAPAAESRMTKQYQTNLAAARLPLPKLGANTAVTQDDVIEVQATWEHYRDAWLAFTSIRYPSVPAMAFRAYFADERYRLLSAMRSQIYRD